MDLEGQRASMVTRRQLEGEPEPRGVGEEGCEGQAWSEEVGTPGSEDDQGD